MKINSKSLPHDLETRKQILENILQENLTKELDEENIITIQHNIRYICDTIAKMEYCMLASQSKIEVLDVFGRTNLVKTEKEVREKFHVPASIPPVYK